MTVLEKTPLKKFGLFAGIISAIIISLLPQPDGMSISAIRTAAVAVLMSVFWLTEALPLYVTALLPIVLFPLLNISSVSESTAPFGHPLVFLFMGGFMIAQGIQKWGLHRRIALKIIHIIGVSPKRIILGFMIGSAFLSMWISNTATALMMLPIGLSVIHLIKTSNSFESDEQRKFSVALLLSIAYSCSIGGVATLIGTPPNALMAAFMFETYNIEISFSEWMLFGIPFTLISLPIAYVLLTKMIFKFNVGSEIDIVTIEDEIKLIGKISYQERVIQLVFLLTAMLWVFRPLVENIVTGISDSSIAVFGAVLLFIIPSREGTSILEWKDAKKISWGILILFGGGLSLAQGIKKSGLAEWIAANILNMGEIPILMLIIILTTAIIFLTEITSNTATAAAFLPIIASIATIMGINSLHLVIPATVAASCAFMLPVATPPNAIIFSSSEISIKNMAQAGIFMNLIFIAIIVFLSFTLGRIVFT